MNDLCAMCYALSHEGSKKLENTVLFETDNFVIIPTLGQFIEGWLMVVSKQHSRSALSMDWDCMDEMSHVVRITRQIIESVYGETIVFEHGHGPNKHQTAGCCVEHTHMHIAPCISYSRFQVQLPFAKSKQLCLQELNNLEDTAYLLLSSERNTDFYIFYPVDMFLPRQYLRQVLAVVADRQSLWDWRLHPCHENIQLTITNLRKSMSKIFLGNLMNLQPVMTKIQETNG